MINCTGWGVVKPTRLKIWPLSAFDGSIPSPCMHFFSFSKKKPALKKKLLFGALASFSKVLILESVLYFMDIKLGKYRHYKGNEYQVLGVAKHSEDLEEFVVYQALYGDRQIWIRPIEMFKGKVTVNGKEVNRFEFLE